MVRVIRYSFLLIIPILVFWSYQRNEIWNTGLSLAQDCAKKSPNKMRVKANYMAELILAGRFEDAIKEGEEGIRIGREQVPYYLYFNLSRGYQEVSDYYLAYIYAREAALRHKDEITLVQLGTVLKQLGYDPVTGKDIDGR